MHLHTNIYMKVYTHMYIHMKVYIYTYKVKVTSGMKGNSGRREGVNMVKAHDTLA